MNDLGTIPGYDNSRASAVNNLGQVVGHAWRIIGEVIGPGTKFGRTAYIYDHRTGEMTDLNQLIPHESGWYLAEADDINDDGQIVGHGEIDGKDHAFLLTPTGGVLSPPQLAPTPVLLTPAPKPPVGDVPGGPEVTRVPGPPVGDQTVESTTYEVLDLGTGDGDWSTARRINDQGEIFWTWATVERRDQKAFLVDVHEVITWDGGEIDLSVASVDSVREAGISDIAGLVPEPSPLELPVPTGYRSLSPAASTEAGLVAGTAYPTGAGSRTGGHSSLSTAKSRCWIPHPVGRPAWPPISMMRGRLLGMPASPAADGFLQPGRAFLYEPSTGTMVDLGTLPGDKDSAAQAINNLGQVVGFSQRLSDGVIEKRPFSTITARVLCRI